jgi:hypothetical protein
MKKPKFIISNIKIKKGATTMMILNFSDPGQVPLIISGEKTQTTVLQGPVKIKIGDVLQACSFAAGVRFGTVKITNVRTQVGKLTFENTSDGTLQGWARLEGFKDFSKANRWFSRVHGKDWMKQYYDIIEFQGDWLTEVE